MVAVSPSSARGRASASPSPERSLPSWGESSPTCWAHGNCYSVVASEGGGGGGGGGGGRIVASEWPTADLKAETPEEAPESPESPASELAAEPEKMTTPAAAASRSDPWIASANRGAKRKKKKAPTMVPPPTCYASPERAPSGSVSPGARASPSPHPIDEEAATAAQGALMGPELRAQLRHIFNKFDLDGSGAISTDEMGRVMAQLKQPKLTEGQLAAMMKDADPDGSGEIEFEEVSGCLCGCPLLPNACALDRLPSLALPLSLSCKAHAPASLGRDGFRIFACGSLSRSSRSRWPREGSSHPSSPRRLPFLASSTPPTGSVRPHRVHPPRQLHRKRKPGRLRMLRPHGAKGASRWATAAELGRPRWPRWVQLGSRPRGLSKRLVGEGLRSEQLRLYLRGG